MARTKPYKPEPETMERIFSTQVRPGRVDSTPGRTAPNSGQSISHPNNVQTKSTQQRETSRASAGLSGIHQRHLTRSLYASLPASPGSALHPLPQGTNRIVASANGLDPSTTRCCWQQATHRTVACNDFTHDGRKALTAGRYLGLIPVRPRGEGGLYCPWTQEAREEPFHGSVGSTSSLHLSFKTVAQQANNPSVHRPHLRLTATPHPCYPQQQTVLEDKLQGSACHYWINHPPTATKICLPQQRARLEELTQGCQRPDSHYRVSLSVALGL